VCKKDTKKEQHEAIPVPNLHVMKLLLSLKSRSFVKETFNWQYSYYTLTDEGIAYLRDYMSIPEDTVPDTLKVKAPPRGQAREGGFAGRGRGFGDRREGGGRGFGGERREGGGRGFGGERREGGGRGFGGERREGGGRGFGGERREGGGRGFGGRGRGAGAPPTEA